MSEIKSAPAEFAALGGERVFAKDLPVGQLNFPSWERYTDAMRSIFEREYYTNHGPLVQELEAKLEARLGVRNALTVTNATVGLYLVLRALESTGSVMLPAFTHVATAQAVSWSGLETAFCDVDAFTHQISASTADAAMHEEVRTVIGVNLWGGSCDAAQLEEWAGRGGVDVVFDSAQAFGCRTASGEVGRFGRAEVFSLHASNVVSCGEGGFIATDDDELAERIRNMRSNYGIRRPLEVPLTINARMAESQAAIALMSLEDFDANVARNGELRRFYRTGIEGIPGLKLVEPACVIRSNEQCLVCEVDEQEFGMSRDDLLTVLRAEGVGASREFAPGVQRTVPYSVDCPRYRERMTTTDAICRKVLQLPLGAVIDSADVERIATVLRDAHALAPQLHRAIRGASASPAPQAS